ncbi:Limulus clotting factor C [Harpegnathos saltator]|uniref:Limulus clotting factor C n=1 Tax=Harpegnathos saltator TaxID=610380 RepID=E2BCT2_HARSA|nr:Limulus clotting factor C [Harpegnathos saltator]
MSYIDICGGSLIRNSLVVSAAHCFYDEDSRNIKNASSFFVAAGKRYRAWDADDEYSQKSLVESIEVDDLYLGLAGNFAMDIALLKLNTPFELNMLVYPICIDWAILYEKDLLQSEQLSKMVIWNKNINDESNQTMYEIDMPYVMYNQCVAESPINLRKFITLDKFCAGRLNDSSVCNQDGGSGLYVQKEGVWYLRGIASVKYGNIERCAYDKSYVGFTYVNYFRDWIREGYDSADDEFLCGSNECVPSNVKCDKKSDCNDSSDEAFCNIEENKETGCALPEKPTGGRYKLEGCDELCRKRSGDIVPQHSILTYTCNDGYMLNSSNTTICLNNIWDYQVSCLKCGKYMGHDEKLIVNGVEVKSEVFPWHVLIYFKEKNMTYIQICSGSLIRNNLVISAAHCFYDEDSRNIQNASSFVVAAGKRYRAWDADEEYSQKSLVESIELDDQHWGEYFMDVALLKLKTPLELNMLVRPICIDREYKFGDIVLQRGLGKMVVWNKNINDQYNQTMYEVEMLYMPNKQCVAKSPIDLRNFSDRRWDRYCAGRLNDSNVCNEDGGSGLYVQIEEVWYLHGVVSDKYGNIDRCAYNNSYVGFTGIGYFVHHIVEIPET